MLSPLLFAGVVLLLFDAFKPAYESNKNALSQYAFTGVVFALLGPLYEWLLSVAIKALAGVGFSAYHVLPALGGYTSWLSPTYFFQIGLAFIAACKRLKLLK